MKTNKYLICFTIYYTRFRLKLKIIKYDENTKHSNEYIV